MVKNSGVKNPSVVVIGAGMTGILLGIKLREAGITDVAILEKADQVRFNKLWMPVITGMARNMNWTC